MVNKGLNFFLYVSLIFVSLTACKKRNLILNSSAKIELSADTIIFDTVFTQRGTITKHCKLYNPHRQPINISELYIAGMNDSLFRMNVDGISGSYHENIEIKANDSLYLFVEATLEANNAINPMIITDSIVIIINNNRQKIDLVAWGQDAYYLYSTNGYFDFAILPDAPNTSIELLNDKPYVVFGYARVDSTQILTVNEGTRLHFHKNSGLYVGPYASLKVNGTLENPVIFESDRLDSEYRDVPGQWGHPLLEGGIILAALSHDNEFNYAEIKHGTFGLRVDSFPNNETPSVILNNCKIENMSYVGLNALNAKVEANNSLFTNCGLYTAALLYGGSHAFNHCTFGNYWSFSSRKNGQIILNNFYESSSGQIISRDLTKANFTNCIIYGNNTNEIELSKSEDQSFDFNYLFSDCLIKVEDTTDSQYNNCIFNPKAIIIDGISHDPVFNDQTNQDFKLFNQSTALNHGAIIPGLEQDFLGISRDNPCDLGPYEFTE